jgi:hypothetical protein
MPSRDGVTRRDFLRLGAAGALAASTGLLRATAAGEEVLTADVLVVGGNPGGVGAAIAAARLGANVILTEETPWLGGPMTAQGVSMMDGNPRLDLVQSGLETEAGAATGVYGEFTRAVRAYYAKYGFGPRDLDTSASVLAFEPHVGAALLERMTAEAGVRVYRGLRFLSARRTGGRVTGALFARDRQPLEIRARQIVDATEQGDVAADAGAALRDDVPRVEGRPVEQALTYVMILKNYGKPQSVARPPGYDAGVFAGLEKVRWSGEIKRGEIPSFSFYGYGRLPSADGRQKLMVNWGNDLYPTGLCAAMPFDYPPERIPPAVSPGYVRGSAADRARIEAAARKLSLGLLYWIQTVWKKDTWGRADDEFPTPDRLPFRPYLRDFRRIEGGHVLTVEDIAPGAGCLRPAVRADGVAVGDYGLDLHLPPAAQAKALEAERVPLVSRGAAGRITPFQIPFGCLVPVTLEGLVMGDAAISKTYVANGATRLQPVRMLIGQAAGVAAALAAGGDLQPRAVSYQRVQRELLRQGVSLYYHGDIIPGHPLFETVEQISLKGFLVESEDRPGTRRHAAFFFRPEERLRSAEALAIEQRLRELRGPQVDPRQWEGLTRAQAAARIADALEQAHGPDWFLKL